MTTWTSPRAGTVYAGDRLMLFRARSIVVVKPWPPMAWLKTATQTWRGCRPELKLDIAPLEARLANARQDADEPPGETSREVDAEAAAAVPQAAQMTVEPAWPAIAHSDGLEQAVAVLQPAIVDADHLGRHAIDQTDAQPSP